MKINKKLFFLHASRISFRSVLTCKECLRVNESSCLKFVKTYEQIERFLYNEKTYDFF